MLQLGIYQRYKLILSETDLQAKLFRSLISIMENRTTTSELIQQNSSDGGFLQSAEWSIFQKSFGRRTHIIEEEGFCASIVEHALPIVGKYFYVPRGPIAEIKNQEAGVRIKNGMRAMSDLARKEGAGWIRIEPTTEEALELMKGNAKEKIVKAPYDAQPKEIFVIDISKPEEQLLAEMKPKTRYNINLAKKKGVVVKSLEAQSAGGEYLEAFLQLTKEMAQRQGITTHPEGYYRKMLEIFPKDMLKLYVAEYAGKIIAANLVLLYGKHATYLHGASGSEHRNVMAPFLLQWQAILDAKARGCEKYDFGGIETPGVLHKAHSDLSGVSAFKKGFSPATAGIVFPGTFDIVVNPRSYALYKGLQRAKMLLRKVRK